MRWGLYSGSGIAPFFTMAFLIAYIVNTCCLGLVLVLAMSVMLGGNSRDLGDVLIALLVGSGVSTAFLIWLIRRLPR